MGIEKASRHGYSAGWRSWSRSAWRSRAALTAVNCAANDRDGTGSPTVRLRPVDGGVDYYAKFSHSLPSDPWYFPIGVWLDSVMSRSDIAKDKSAGVNLYVGVADPEGSNLRLLRAHGQKALIGSDERTRFAGIGSETAGWLLTDEIDMTDGPRACRGRLRRVKSGLPADGRARYNNYGKGVLLWETAAQAACFVEAQHLAVFRSLLVHRSQSAEDGRSAMAAEAETADDAR